MDDVPAQHIADFRHYNKPTDIKKGSRNFLFYHTCSRSYEPDTGADAVVVVVVVDDATGADASATGADATADASATGADAVVVVVVVVVASSAFLVQPTMATVAAIAAAIAIFFELHSITLTGKKGGIQKPTVNLHFFCNPNLFVKNRRERV